MRRLLLQSHAIVLTCCVGTLPGSFNAAAERLRSIIMERDLEVYMALLQLDDDQRAIGKALFADYVDERVHGPVAQQATAYRESERAAIEEVAAATSAGEDPSEAVSRVSPALNRELDRVNVLLDAIDEAFLQDLEALLIDEQLGRMARVRHARQRRININYNPLLPGSEVDIVSLLYGVVGPTDWPAMLDDFLTRFEPTYVAALKNRVQMEFATADDVNKARSIGFRLDDETLAEAKRAELRDDYRRVHYRYAKKGIDAAGWIVRLNRQALRELTHILSEDEHARLVSSYQRAAYPKLYPDPASAEPMIAAALALDELEQYQLEAIRRWTAAYRRQHADLTKRMAEATDQYCRLRTLQRERDRGDVIRAYHIIIDLGEQRELLNDQQVYNLEFLLTPDQFALLPEWPEEHERPWARP